MSASLGTTQLAALGARIPDPKVASRTAGVALEHMGTGAFDVDFGVPAEKTRDIVAGAFRGIAFLTRRFKGQP